MAAQNDNDEQQVAKKQAAFAKYTKQLREHPSHYCPGGSARWVGAAGRRCRSKRAAPAMYKEAEPCIFNRSWPGYPAKINVGFSRCLICDKDRLREAETTHGGKVNLKAVINAMKGHPDIEAKLFERLSDTYKNRHVGARDHHVLKRPAKMDWPIVLGKRKAALDVHNVHEAKRFRKLVLDDQRKVKNAFSAEPAPRRTRVTAAAGDEGSADTLLVDTGLPATEYSDMATGLES
eukprot:15447896-Alexandrium_andersonii.AAC.1